MVSGIWELTVHGGNKSDALAQRIKKQDIQSIWLLKMQICSVEHHLNFSVCT